MSSMLPPKPIVEAGPAKAASPCNSVCRIDERSGLCAGCWRTLAEIAGWATMDEAARRAVLVELERRRT